MKISVKEMLDAGLHFGHRTQKWNPKMAPYIYTKRAGIHIFDLQKTAQEMVKTLNFLYSASAQGREILFVSTKLQTEKMIVDIAEKTNSHYVNNRWLGGLLTNFDTIKHRIKYYKDLKKLLSSDAITKYRKKEQVMKQKELEKLDANLCGLSELRRLPDVLVVIDMVRDNIAIREAKRLGITVVAIADSNANPDDADYIIPANDDAMGSLQYIFGKMQEVMAAGQKNAPKKESSDAAPSKKAAPKKKITVTKKDVAEKGDA
ncbi:MAG: 30S ribosomal protein S2 [Patescibacteria group bacterium]|nr:30S ribosomal protein S2 [Patescibacteria group bacterium]